MIVPVISPVIQNVVKPVVRRGLDADAAAYIAAVEAADTQALEPSVKQAYDDFIVGCKSDGIWDAIKASCIMAGARTLEGALVPLKGTAPTNVGGLFVSGDYNRKTGLVGDGSTKYLDSNRNNNVTPQNDTHFSVYVTATSAQTTNFLIAAGTGTQTGRTGITQFNSNWHFRANNVSSHVPGGKATGFNGVSRNNASNYTARTNNANTTANTSSQTPFDGNIGVFSPGDGAGTISSDRLSFYSIGESLDLAKLDTRVSNLMTAIDAAL